MGLAQRMRTSLTGRIVTRFYGRVPFSSRLLNLAIRLEGGEMTSLSLRRVLKDRFRVDVGDYSYGSLLRPNSADAGTVIGRYVSVGPNVRRFGASHPMERRSMHPYWYNPAYGLVARDQDVERTAIWIGHDSWIGANVLILPSVVRIGVGAVVGAGTVLTKDVPDFAVVVGNPGRLVKYRFEANERQALLALAPWEMEPAIALAYLRDPEREKNVGDDAKTSID